MHLNKTIEELKSNHLSTIATLQQQLLQQTHAQDAQSATLTAITHKYSAALTEASNLRQTLDRAAFITCNCCHATLPTQMFFNHTCSPKHNNSAAAALDSSILTLTRQPMQKSQVVGLQLEIIGMNVKECMEQRKMYAEYRIKARRSRKAWEVARKYKEFRALWDELAKNGFINGYSAVIKAFFQSSKGEANRMDERQKMLQEFLQETASQKSLADSEIVRRFLDEPEQSDLNRTLETGEETDLTAMDILGRGTTRGDADRMTMHSFSLRELERPKSFSGMSKERKASNVAVKENILNSKNKNDFKDVRVSKELKEREKTKTRDKDRAREDSKNKNEDKDLLRVPSMTSSISAQGTLTRVKTVASGLKIDISRGLANTISGKKLYLNKLMNKR